MKFQESQLAHKYLDGLNGIEIGASAHNPFNIPNCIYVDKYESLDTIYKQQEKELSDEVIVPNIIAEGDILPFEDSSLDYVLSSHVFEHFYDPIRTMKEWIRVTKNNGIIFIIFPHKDRTFDVDKPRTKLKELTDRHEFKLINNEDTHHYFWITEDGLEFCKYMNLNVIEYLDIDDKVGNGFCIVIKVEK